MNSRIGLLGIIAFIVFSGCQKKWHVADVQPSSYRMAKNSSLSDPGVDSLIRPYRNSLEDEMNEIVAFAEMDLYKSKPESKLGNWVADLLKEEAETLHGGSIDFAIQNYGGLRIPGIPKGPVTKGKMFELMPFDNQLILVYIPYKEMLQLLNKIADYGGWPVSDGLQMSIVDGKAVQVKIGGESLKEENVYLVAMPDYIANGGDNCFFLKPLKREEYGVFIREAIIQNSISKHSKGIKMSAKIMNRIN
jgi:2',3'-cyclic-nucleotide 2'-phosphodiesterase (5'-nucleotidase family)